MKKIKSRESLSQHSDIFIVSEYPTPLMGFVML